MQKESSRNSLIGNLHNYAISKEFLDVPRYKLTVEINRNNSIFYEILCSKIQNYYKLIYDIPTNTSMLLQSNPHLERWEFKKFKQYMKNMFNIFHLISEFQIGSFSNIRMSQIEFNSLQSTYQNFISHLEKYQKDQEKYQALQIKYRSLFEQLQIQEKYLKGKIKKTHYYFNMGFVSTQLSSFQEKLNQKQEIQTQIQALSQVIGTNSKQFQKDFMFLKQKMVMNKYENVEKLSKLCKTAKQSIMEITTYLYQYFESNEKLFALDKKNLDQANRFKNVPSKEMETYIHSEITHYCNILNEYTLILNELITSFVYLSQTVKGWKGKQMEYIQNLKKFYEFDECNISEIQQIFHLYNTFLKFIGQLGDKLVFSVNNFTQLEKKVNKCAQLTITLTKCKRRSPTNSQRQIIDQEEEKRYLDILDEQMSVIYVQSILNRINSDFREAVIKIRDEFLVTEPNKKKKIDNSMSISYLSQTYSSPRQKRPSKSQYWLWHNWKIQIQKDFQFSDDLQNMLKHLVTLTSEYKKEDKDVDSLSCQPSTKKVKGALKLRNNSLLFEANDRQLSLFVPFCEVEGVDLQLKMISKTLLVQTPIGPLSFTDFTEGTVNKFFVSVQRCLDSFREKGSDCPPSSAKVVLSPEELQHIKKRRSQIEKQLQTEEPYKIMYKEIIPDVHIADVYKVLYSGQPVILNGKQYENFNVSLAKKAQNQNFTFGSYDTPGPYFYSGNKEITFFNCPVSSVRVIEYDHLLPKIPLFPESCHNCQTERVYWVSDEEIRVKVINVMSKAPFTENFNMHVFVTIKQLDKDVELAYYQKIHEVKNFAFKNSIYEKSIAEATRGTQMVVDQLKKIMVRYRKKVNDKQSSGEHVGQHNNSLNSDKTVIKQYKKTVKGLKGQVKYLKFLLAGAFLLNILIMFLF